MRRKVTLTMNALSGVLLGALVASFFTGFWCVWILGPLAIALIIVVPVDLYLYTKHLYHQHDEDFERLGNALFSLETNVYALSKRIDHGIATDGSEGHLSKTIAKNVKRIKEMVVTLKEGGHIESDSIGEGLVERRTEEEGAHRR